MKEKNQRQQNSITENIKKDIKGQNPDSEVDDLNSANYIRTSGTKVKNEVASKASKKDILGKNNPHLPRAQLPSHRA